jgi:hypothetical protein
MALPTSFIGPTLQSLLRQYALEDAVAVSEVFDSANKQLPMILYSRILYSILQPLRTQPVSSTFPSF